MTTHAHYWVVFQIKTRKVGQTDLGFGMRSGFMSVRARLQVSGCSSYDLCHRRWQFFRFLHIDPVTLKSGSKQTRLWVC